MGKSEALSTNQSRRVTSRLSGHWISPFSVRMARALNLLCACGGTAVEPSHLTTSPNTVTMSVGQKWSQWTDAEVQNEKGIAIRRTHVVCLAVNCSGRHASRSSEETRKLLKSSRDLS